MQENTTTGNREEKRSELRKVLDRYYSVEFKLKETGGLYHFKLRDLSSKSLGILVNEDSAVLEHLAVNDILKMKYYPPEASSSAEFLTTKIIHITKKEHGSFKGHFLIGLLIIEKHASDNKT
ncbi:MAG: hypothetical protein BA867_12295 [Desulfobacterales bacterium S5133MH16]|jgi:hypothetical protein|nr:MAG: hypothetical protein BA867_12295 [Desulfobacterales bacterium S5133MH16]